MGRFYSIPGCSVHQASDDPRPASTRDATIYGDQPGMVEVPVIDPNTGNELYKRKVFDRSFTPGLDEHDSISYHGDPLEKVADIHDSRAARTTTVYRRFDNLGKYKGEVKVEHEQISEKGDNVIARTSRSGS